MGIANLQTTRGRVEMIASTQAATGAYVLNYATRIDNVVMQMRSKIKTETDEFGKTVSREVWRCYMEYNANTKQIIASDRIVWPERNNRIFQLLGDPYDVANRHHHLQLELEEIRVDGD